MVVHNCCIDYSGPCLTARPMCGLSTAWACPSHSAEMPWYTETPQPRKKIPTPDRHNNPVNNRDRL